jgi:capsule biosynthesis phosphatase
MKKYRFCIDLDGTICHIKNPNQNYIDIEPLPGAIEFLNELKSNGHYIIIYTARNMLTYQDSLGKIIANQAPVVIEWLKKYQIPYDELLFGKPFADYYIDDKSVEFKTWEKIKNKIKLS